VVNFKQIGVFMQYGKFFKSVVLAMSMFVLVGCGSSSSSSDTAATASVNEEIPAANFANGTVTTETAVAAQDGDTVVAVATVEEGTQFTTASGEVSTEAPVLVMDAAQGATGEQSKLSINFVDASGNKLVPTAPVAVSVLAPEGSAPGDKVTIDVPEGVNASSKQEKLTVFIVDGNGMINIIILPQVFVTQDVIVFIVIPPVLTGAQG
jgi:hypothetical protein